MNLIDIYIKPYLTAGLGIAIGAIGLMLAWLWFITIPNIEHERDLAYIERDLSNALLKTQNEKIKENELNASKVAELPKQIETIKTVLKPIYHTIYERIESNETSECNNSYLYNFDFVGVFNKAMLAADSEYPAENNSTGSETPHRLQR